MAISMGRAKALCTATELDVVRASTQQEIGKLTAARLRQKETQARKLRDKWRDQAASQKRSTQAKIGSRDADYNKNSAEKAELFDEVLSRFSAQLAKKFYDFQVRGGMIESSGGFGFDYTKGVVGVHFDAFDFSTRFGERPHLKAWANLDLTKNFYLVGGADDIINRDTPGDWFVGVGFRLVDEDFKGLLGLGASAAR